MRKNVVMWAGQNEYEDGHLMSYRGNHTGSSNKDPDNNRQFYPGISAVHMRFFAYKHVAAFKNPCFSHRFSERALSYFIYRFISRESARPCFCP